MDTKEKNVTRERRGGLATAVTVAALLGTVVGIGIGIGIGAGIWKDDGVDTNTVSTTGDVCDASVEHDDSLVTYILSMDEYELRQRPGTEFIDVYVSKDSLPSSMPYLINDVKNGVLFENLLNTTMFLEDWSILSSQTTASLGEFAMPGYAAAKQCYQDYELDATSATTPPNAMVIRDDEPNVERLVHVYNVTEEPDRFIFTLLPVKDEKPTILPEGQCHTYQNLSSPHFHHVSNCLEYDADWIVGQNGTRGVGLTAFIKLGPVVDSGLIAAGTDLLASGGTEAAVDAGVDAGADAGADAASDAGYDGDDIVSDASSDGASDRSDTFIGDERPQGGGGPGIGTAAVVGGAIVGTTAALTPEPEDPDAMPPRG